jgi:transcriptional regulator with XRE-family HTH domain
MKPAREVCARLGEAIETERKLRGLSYALLGDQVGVDASQAFKICKGRFATINPSVIRLCATLDVKISYEGINAPRLAEATSAAQLQAAVLAAWDSTPQGAQRLKRILRALS